jgi:molybdopterin-guanine dinucleotide biosynthesis protein A
MNDSPPFPSPPLPFPPLPDSVPPTALAAYILAGGRSRRFGEDKAEVEIDGKPQLVRLTDDLHRLGCSVSVVTSRPEAYRQLGLRTLVDRRPGLGPLAGLERALEDAEPRAWPVPWVLVLACDTLELPSRWLGALCQALWQRLQSEPRRRSQLERRAPLESVCLFTSACGESPVGGAVPPMDAGSPTLAVKPAGPRLNPFPGLYPIALLPVVRDALAGEDRSLQRLLGGGRLRVEQVRSPVGAIATANTRDQLDRWLEARRRPIDL